MGLNDDGLVKNHKSGGTVKSSRCKARESLGMRRTYQYAADGLFAKPSMIMGFVVPK
jgi:hypothetical protein